MSREEFLTSLQLLASIGVGNKFTDSLLTPIQSLVGQLWISGKINCYSEPVGPENEYGKPRRLDLNPNVPIYSQPIIVK